MSWKLITGGRLVHAHGEEQTDILINNQQIHSLGRLAEIPNPCQIIEASDKLIFPGVIDPHTHMGIPIKTGNSADDFASGSRSALHGGVTTILDFTVLSEDQTLQLSLAERIDLAKRSSCDVGIHINVSRFDEALLKEIPSLIRAGFNSFKTFTTYEEAGMMLRYDQIQRLAEIIASHDGLLMVHSEDNNVIAEASKPYLSEHATHPRYHALSRPPSAEAVAIRELGEISGKTGCVIYIVHLNTAEGLMIAAEYPNLRVETCPHYLFLDASAYERPDGRMFVASPPLRSKADQVALWNGIVTGTIHTVGSDHCPFCLADKRTGQGFQEIPNGMGGVETLFPTLLAGFLERNLDLSILSRLTSHNPAAIFQLDAKKGELSPGMDADLLIVDPKADPHGWEKQLTTHLDWNAYTGLPALFPETVIRRGELLVQNHTYQAVGKGELLRATSAG